MISLYYICSATWLFAYRDLGKPVFGAQDASAMVPYYSQSPYSNIAKPSIIHKKPTKICLESAEIYRFNVIIYFNLRILVPS